MSDPHALPDHPKTPRAQPLQPDKPGSGDQQQMDLDIVSPRQRANEVGEKTARDQESQSKDALENVREGYD
jgi:hypothetical protein